jgi:YVTN family beta-propeller protein
MKRAVISQSIVVLLLMAGIRAADGPYNLIKEVPIGGPGGWDYLNIDPGAKRLYISHATKVVVYDLANDSIVGEIADTPGVHGAVRGPGGRVFTSNGRENKASIVDAGTLQTIAKVDTEGNPDFIMFEPAHNEIYTMNGSGRSATVIGADGKVVATIPLGGKPEAGVSDPAAGRVYINNETGNSIVVIDSAKHEVVANWAIAPGTTAAGLAIDLKNHRLFIGARNNLMLMMDSTNGKVVSQVPIGAGVDSTWFDPGTSYAVSSCGDGTTTIAHEDAPDKLTVVQTLKTARGARTMALDSATHRLYLAAAKYQEPAAGAPSNAPPEMIPGSMHLLVYGLAAK